MTYRKFHNHVTTEYCKWAGKIVTFHSDKEKKRWNELNLAQAAGQIKDLERQTDFDFYYYHWDIYEDYLCRGKVKQRKAKPKFICTYKADFTYHERVNGKWKFIVEDSKGVKTAIYQRSKKMMKHWFGIDVLET